MEHDTRWMVGEVGSITRSAKYALDVLIHFENASLAVEWPPDDAPDIGDMVKFDGFNCIEWQGSTIGIDVRKPRLDANGHVYFD